MRALDRIESKESPVFRRQLSTKMGAPSKLRLGGIPPAQPVVILSGINRLSSRTSIASRKPALSEDRECDRSRMGTCIFRRQRSTKMGAPSKLRLGGIPPTLRLHSVR